MAYVAKKFSLDALNTALAANQQTFQRQAHNDQQKMGMKQLEMQTQQQGFENRTQMMRLSMEAQMKAHQQAMDLNRDAREGEVSAAQVRVLNVEAEVAERTEQDRIEGAGLQNEATEAGINQITANIAGLGAQTEATELDTETKKMFRPHHFSMLLDSANQSELETKEKQLGIDRLINENKWMVDDRERQMIDDQVNSQMLSVKLETERENLAQIRDENVRNMVVREHSDLVALDGIRTGQFNTWAALKTNQSSDFARSIMSSSWGEIEYAEDKTTPVGIKKLRPAWDPIASAHGYDAGNASEEITKYFHSQVPAKMAADPNMTQDEATQAVFKELTLTAALDQFSKLKIKPGDNRARLKSYQAYLAYTKDNTPENAEKMLSYVGWKANDGSLKIVNDSYPGEWTGEWKDTGDHGPSLHSNFNDYYNVVVQPDLRIHIGDNISHQKMIDDQLRALETTNGLYKNQARILDSVIHLPDRPTARQKLNARTGAGI